MFTAQYSIHFNGDIKNEHALLVEAMKPSNQILSPLKLHISFFEKGKKGKWDGS